MNEETRDFVVLGVDVISYSQLSLQLQKQAQQRLDHIFYKTIQNMTWQRPPFWIDAGDGGYALFDGQEDKVIETLVRFQADIDDDNASRSDSAKLYFRYAIHKDQIFRWKGELGDKFTGNALNNCARLLNGMSKSYQGQVVCSQPIVDALTAFKAPNVTITRLRDITDKHGHKHPTYNLQRSPGLGVEPKVADQHENPLDRHVT